MAHLNKYKIYNGPNTQSNAKSPSTKPRCQEPLSHHCSCQIQNRNQSEFTMATSSCQGHIATNVEHIHDTLCKQGYASNSDVELNTSVVYVYDNDMNQHHLPQAVLDHWNTVPQLREDIRTTTLLDYKATTKLQLLRLLQRCTPIPGEDIIHVDLTDPDLVVPPEFLAFELHQSDSLATNVSSPIYKGVQKEKFEEVLIKGTHESSLCDVADDTFLKQPPIRKCSLVCVSGGGGLGKTTQLMKLALDWHTGASFKLSNYEFVLYVPITGLSDPNRSFVDILFDSGTFPDSYRGDSRRIETFLQHYKHSDKFLIILDGYGKGSNKIRVLNDIINGENCYFPQATVVVSGRPYYMKNLKTKRNPDMHVDILGIEDKSIPILFKNILKSNEQVEELQEICSLVFFDQTLLRIPLFAVLSCFIFHSNKAKNIDVCNHNRPTTMTGLFNTILRVFLKIMASSKGDTELDVHFDRSPLLDANTKLPSNTRRFLWALGKMSYNALKEDRYLFDKKDLDSVFLDPEEVCSFGLLVCMSEFEICKDTGRMMESENIVFAFRNSLFQEYMAAMYLSKDFTNITDELLSICQRNLRVNKHSLDSGFESMVSISNSNQPNKKPRKQCHWYKRLGFGKSRSKNVKQPTETVERRGATGNSFYVASRMPVEHSCDDRISTPLSKAKSCGNIPLLTGIRPLPVEHDENQRFVPEIETDDGKVCLYDMINPFQSCALFASGMNPDFTIKFLETFGPHVKAKVCQYNVNKFDVGYESALFCEALDPSLNRYFFEYLIHLNDRVGTCIQFPTPYDEFVTNEMAVSFTNQQVLTLLKTWYDVDLRYRNRALEGANIVSTAENCLEMNDPCLFEVCLLHRYTFENVTELMITGNYFPDFFHIAKSFPNLKRLLLDSVNHPSTTDKGEFSEHALKGCPLLEEVAIRNGRASFPLNESLLAFLKTSEVLKSLKICGIKYADNFPRLLATLHCFGILQTLHLQNVGLGCEVFINSETQERTSFCTILSRLPLLTELDLSENQIGISLPGLAYALGKRNKHMKVLSLSKCKIKPETFHHFSAQVHHLTSLKNIDISNNNLSTSAQELVKQLRSCDQLRSINLSNCNLNPGDINAMSFYLNQLSSLTCLNLTDNTIASEGENLLVCLPKGLEKLKMCRCGLRTVGYRGNVVTAAIAGFTRLDHLSLQGNDLRDGLQPILEGLRNTKIQHLNIRKCLLRPNDFRLASKTFHKLKPLSELVIGMNTMCYGVEDERDKVFKSLRACKRLTKIVSCQMNGEHFTRDQLGKLRDGGRVEVISFRRE